MLDELRTANPIPVVPAVDGSALYTRITSLPADPRLTSRRRSRLVVVAIAFAAAAVIASAAYGVSSWLGAAVKPPVTLREYHEAQADLSLPPGYSWPTLHVGTNSVTSPGAGGGHAVAIAMSDWECYWSAAIRTGDQAAQHRAQKVLLALLRNNVVVAPDGASENWSPPSVQRHHPTAVFADDGGYQYKERMYRGGDATLLAQSCVANG